MDDKLDFFIFYLSKGNYKDVWYVLLYLFTSTGTPDPGIAGQFLRLKRCSKLYNFLQFSFLQKIAHRQFFCLIFSFIRNLLKIILL